jgi:hypothetical protein
LGSPVMLPCVASFIDVAPVCGRPIPPVRW